MSETTAEAKTHANRAHFLRMVARAITDDGLPGPLTVNMWAKWGGADLRFDDNEPTAVDAWARLLEAEAPEYGDVFDEDTPRAWRSYGVEYIPWRGWTIKLWASVDVAVSPVGGAVAEGEAQR